MGMPTNGTATEIMARSLTNEALATRIEQMVGNIRKWNKEEREAYLSEAARRLRWNTGSDPAPADEDELQELYDKLTPDMLGALVVGGHDPMWLAAQVSTNDHDTKLLKRIAKMERAEAEVEELVNAAKKDCNQRHNQYTPVTVISTDEGEVTVCSFCQAPIDQ